MKREKYDHNAVLKENTRGSTKKELLNLRIFAVCLIFVLSFIPIHTTVKKLVTCFCETVWLIDTLSLGLSVLAIYLIFYLTRGVLVFFTKSVKNTWNEIKEYYVKIYMDIYYPTPQNNNNIIENVGLISYSQSISLIRQSAYGLKAKHKAIKSCRLKETGGKTVIKVSFITVLQAKEYQEYVPSTEDKIELGKEELLYDLIFQEFSSGYGYLDKDYNLKKDIFYSKILIKIQENQLNEFLRIKELELQKEFLILKHIA